MQDPSGWIHTCDPIVQSGSCAWWMGRLGAGFTFLTGFTLSEPTARRVLEWFARRDAWECAWRS